ncbi:MAG: tRNA glutamyl-Q(34) synthetase GluQRS [Betaproteobacteria bacterium]
MGYVGRFAPSPTGPLHFGSLVAALASYLDAKANDGKWLVRIEDIDETRCKPEYATDILRDLQSFGMQWDGEVETQTLRKPFYEDALQKLNGRGLTYACVCSRKEIADSATAGLEGPVYPGTCRNLHIAVDHESAAIRVRTTSEMFAFTDIVQGKIEQCIEQEIGDFVLKRRDGLFAYQLAVVVDDAAQGVTHIVRGADLLDSTARQIYLQKLLGMPTPQYLHIPVAVNAQGQKLSKQTLASAISANGGNACGLLLSALGFLGQQVMALPLDPTNGELLTRAAQNWDRRRIPRSRTATSPYS